MKLERCAAGGLTHEVAEQITFSCDRQGVLNRHWRYIAGFDGLNLLAKPNQSMLPMIKLVTKSGQTLSAHLRAAAMGLLWSC
jgi:hypothetical protein